jgi:hypothetical protein
MHNSIEQMNGQTRACIERLRSLPTETLPPYNWQEFQRRSQQRFAAAHAALDWRPLAAAAAFLLFVCAIAIWGRLGSSGRHVVADSGAVEDGGATWKPGAVEDGANWRQGAGPPVNDSERLWQAQASGSGVSAGETAAREGAPRAIGSGESTFAANRSRAIESWLATLPHEPAVVRVGTRAAVAGLEDRIAQVDDLMTSVRIDGLRPDRLAALQQERLRLVGSLAQVRYAEVVASESP